jgi:hypothetical protein
MANLRSILKNLRVFNALIYLDFLTTQKIAIFSKKRVFCNIDCFWAGNPSIALFLK